MKREEYNGWTNYETWNVALWMDNERGSFDYWRERAKAVFDSSESDKTFTKEERARIDLAGIIKNEFLEGMPDLGASTYADLLSGAMSEVNWDEIATHIMNEITEVA